MDLSSSSDRYSFNPELKWNPQVEEYFVKAYGAEHFARISKALTHPSCYSCIRVNTLRSTSETVINKLMELLDDKKLFSTMGCMNMNDHNNEHGEHNVTSKCAGDEFASKEEVDKPFVSKCQYPGLDNVVFVRGSGPHNLHYGNQPGKIMKEVIVSRKCAEAVLRGAQIFVPGVLACSQHVEKGDVVAVSVALEQPLPDGKWGFGITRGIVLQGNQSDPQFNERFGNYIGQGIASMSRAGIFRALNGIAIEMTKRVYKLPSFYDVLEGEIFLQNLPSIIAARVLDPQEGERILDMCAAPGGKTTAIAILMKDRGEVVATDRSHNKVMDIKKLAAEMGLTCINAYKLDALKSVCHSGSIDVFSTDPSDQALKRSVINPLFQNSENGSIAGCTTDNNRRDVPSKADMHISAVNSASNGNASNGRYLGKSSNEHGKKNGTGRNNRMGARVGISKGFAPDSFDRVLLDAPCSALGLRPRLFAGEETIDSLRHHATYQRRLFDQAIQLVRPGGVIVYSTCTINPGENEALVRYALDKYRYLSLAPQHPKIGGHGLVGNCELFDGKYKEEWLTEAEAELVQRFDPSSSLDTIGFFIAKFNVGQKTL